MSGFATFGNRSYSIEKQDYIGLSNQGATCYMNSLLQTLYMTPEFRQEVYKWVFSPETHGEQEDCIPFQLQMLFGKLQVSDAYYVETTALTKSFQWDTGDSFQQHDVQEFCRVLFDALEQSVENTAQSEFIKELYEGTYIDYVKCMGCLHESSREDKFLDLSLTVRNTIDKVYNDSVEKALKSYITPEELSGDNQYFCSKCESKQDALKGLKFKELPYILVLQLKRFDLDYETMNRIKLNDVVSFPQILNMNSYVLNLPIAEEEQKEEEGEQVEVMNYRPADLSSRDIVQKIMRSSDNIFEDDDKKPLKLDAKARKLHMEAEAVRNRQKRAELIEKYRQDGENVYELYSVMIHSGSAMGGHYYAYIKSFEKNQWYNFNDSSVKLIDDNYLKKVYGGISNSFWSSSSTAYLLMYRKVDEAQNALSVHKSAVPPYVLDELEKELERERKEEEERQERLKYINIRVFFKGKDKSIEIKPEELVGVLLAKAVEEFEISEFTFDNIRLRGYSQYYECLQEVYDTGKSLENQGVYYSKIMGLETKEPHDEWEPYDPNVIQVKVFCWNSELEGSEDAYEEMTRTPTILKIDKRTTIQKLMEICEEKFGIPANEMKICKKGYMSTYMLEVLNSPHAIHQTVALARVSNGAILYVEHKTSPYQAKWHDLLVREANKYTIRFNQPNKPPNIYGQYEFKDSVLIDSNKTLRELKTKISEKIGIEIDQFIMKRGSKHGNELKDLDLKIKSASFANNSSVFVEKGEPAKPDEVRLELFLSGSPQENDGDGVLYSFEKLCSLSVHMNSTFDKVKALVASALPEPVSVSRIRIREKFYEKLGKTVKNADPVKSHQYFDRKNFGVQILDTDEEDIPHSMMIISARRWHSSTWELSAPIEMIASKQWKMHDLGEILSEKFSIPHNNLGVYKVRHAMNFSRSELEYERFDRTERESHYLCGYPWFMSMDGELFIVRDMTEEKRPMTAEEKQKYGVRSYNGFMSIRFEEAKEQSVKITVKSKQKQSEDN